MSVIVPTGYTELRGLRIRPGAKIVDDVYSTIAQNAHHLYARGSERLPIFWDESPLSTTSTSYVQPDGLDRFTAIWRPTRIADNDYYRMTLLVYGVDADVRMTTYDATVGGGGSLATTTVSCGSTPEWGENSERIASSVALDGSGDPIPLAVSFELRTSATTAEVYQIAIVSQILTSSTLP